VAEALTDLAVDYFDHLAGQFPVMCASDEFHFLPRARTAGRYYDRLDDLDPAAIHDCVQVLNELQGKMTVLAAQEHDPERLLDFEFL